MRYPARIMKKGIKTLSFAILLIAMFPCYAQQDLSIEDRVSDLVLRMTLEEKVSQMMNHSVAIPRLDIPEYDWWTPGNRNQNGIFI